MKKMFALAAVLCLALAGCEYDDAEVKDRLDDLEGRVDALEKTVNSLNINVGNLQSLIDGKLFITAVTENPEGGGYTLSLVTSDGEASQIVIKDGEAGAAPAIGVKLDSDGKYYWTLDGEFITEGGKKMPVTGDDGVTPVSRLRTTRGTSPMTRRRRGRSAALQRVPPATLSSRMSPRARTAVGSI